MSHLFRPNLFCICSSSVCSSIPSLLSVLAMEGFFLNPAAVQSAVAEAAEAAGMTLGDYLVKALAAQVAAQEAAQAAAQEAAQAAPENAPAAVAAGAEGPGLEAEHTLLPPPLRKVPEAWLKRQ